MLRKLFSGLLLFKCTLVLAKEAELPLCPTNVLYFPQNLPMHCRMPTNADLPGNSGALPTVPPFYQNPSSDKLHPIPFSIPIPQGVPGPLPIPGPMPMPGQVALSGPMAMPAPMLPGPPGAIPLSGPMPIPAGPAHKLPVIVMPFYSPDPAFKKTERANYLKHSFRPRRKIRHRRRRLPYISPDTSSTDTETSSDGSSSSSSEYQGWWKGRKNHRRFNGPIKIKNRKRNQKRQLLTPVLQYVTKDGYVIFEKKISRNEAKDWLNVKKDENVDIGTRASKEVRDVESNEHIDNHTKEKEMATENNVEIITTRNTHRLDRIKAHRNRATRKKLYERQL